VIATRLTLRDFRSYAAAEVQLGPGLTVVSGRNGAGKTNLLEAIYFACTGRSCRTGNERECVRFGAQVTRLELHCEDAGQRHELSVGFQPGEPKRLRVDGAPVERLTDVSSRPLVSVFLPDRLELVTGAPALRRAHLDQVVAALRPARAATRRAYGAALSQRNALVAAINAGRAGRASMPAWDAELARHGAALMADRAAAVEELRPRFSEHAAALGLTGEPDVLYRPRSNATTAEQLASELAGRLESDIERGFTGHGPHRDVLV
jgi:DNA replication and repair protein RecF